jgi:hypothetical protein
VFFGICNKLIMNGMKKIDSLIFPEEDQTFFLITVYPAGVIP